MRATITILVLALISIGESDLWAQQVGQKIVVAKENARFKEGSKLDDVKVGDLFEVFKRDGDWLEIYGGGSSGWISKSDVVTVENAEPIYDSLVKNSPDKKLAYKQRGRFFLLIGKIDQSIKDFSKALKLDDKDIEIYLERGMAWLVKGQNYEAIRDFESVIKLDPKNPVGYANRGNAWMRMRLPRKAINDVTKAIEIDSKHAPAFHTRGLAYQELGQFDNAKSDFNKAVELDSEKSAYFNSRGTIWLDLQKYDEALKDFNKANELSPNEMIILLNRGKTLYALKKLDKAEAEFSKAVEIQPDNFFPYYYRSDVWMKLANARKSEKESYLKKAIADLDKVVSFDRSFIPAYLSRYFAQIAIGNYDSAKADLRELIRLRFNPPQEAVTKIVLTAAQLKVKKRFQDAVDVYGLLIVMIRDDFLKSVFYSMRGEILHEELEDLDEALKDFNQSIRLASKKSSETYKRRGSVWYDKGEMGKAIADYNVSIQLKPDYPYTYYLRAKSFRNKKEFDKAINDLDQAIELAPKQHLYYRQRGITWSRKGESKKAIDDYSRALELNEKYYLAYTSRGNEWRKLSEWDKAISDFSKAIEIDPKDPYAYRRRARTFSSKNEFKQALPDYDKVLEFEPKDASAMINRGWANQCLGNYVKAVSDYQGSIRTRPDNSALARNNLAWLLATCPDEKIRNGKRAVEEARKACESTEWKKAIYLDTLATAYAEVGEFSKALEWQKKAIELGSEEDIPKSQNRLKLYEQGKPFRTKLGTNRG